MNPETCAAILRRLVVGWDGNDQAQFIEALNEARRLLGLRRPDGSPLREA